MASRFDEEEKPSKKVVSLPVVVPKPEPSFPYTWVSDAVLKLDTRPLIKGILDPGAFAVIYGPSGSGKSFFTADLAQHIAQGMAWRGRKVTRGLVVYVASEAGASILKRFVGWRDRKMGDAVGRIPLAVLTRGPNLLSSVEFEKLAEQLKGLEAESGLPIVLVIFDTLSRSIPGGDENNAEDMTLAVRAGDYLRDQFNCATIFVHHTGKDPEKGARGHSALFAAADLVLRVMDKAATVEKVRDGVSGERFGFELEPIEIGVDSDGDQVFTCLLIEADARSTVSPKKPVGTNQKIVFPVIQVLIAESTVRSPGSSTIPKGVILVSLQAVSDRAVDKFGGEDPKWRVRDKIKTAVIGLQGQGLISVQGDYIWLT